MRKLLTLSLICFAFAVKGQTGDSITIADSGSYWYIHNHTKHQAWLAEKKPAPIPYHIAGTNMIITPNGQLYYDDNFHYSKSDKERIEQLEFQVYTLQNTVEVMKQWMDLQQKINTKIH